MNEFDVESLHRVFHQSIACRNGICKELSKELDVQIEDGSWLCLFECLKCGKRVHIGVDKNWKIIQRDFFIQKNFKKD